MNETEQEAEGIARRLACEAGHEPLWELYLSKAYDTLSFFPVGEVEKTR